MSKRLILSVIFLTICLDFFNLGLIYPIFSSLVFEGSGGLISNDSSELYKNTLFGFLIAAFPFGQFLGAPILGQLSDHYGRRKLLIISLIGTVATLLLCAFGVIGSSLAILFAGRFIGGLMAGNMTLAYASLTDFSAPEEKVRNFALIPLATGVGFAFGPYLAGILANPETSNWTGPAIPFFAAALFSIVNLLLAIWKFPETSTPKAQPIVFKKCLSGVASLSKAFRPTFIRPYLWILFLMISANLLFVQFIGPFAIETFNANVTEVGYLYANIGVSVALGHAFLTRKLAKSASPETALAGSLIALGSLLVTITISPNLWALHVVTAAVMMACAVGYTNSMALVSNQASQDQQGEIMGIAVSIQSCSEFLPASIVGLVAAFSQNIPILVAAACAFVPYFILSSLMKNALKDPLRDHL